jgi:hypothetical protein
MDKKERMKHQKQQFADKAKSLNESKVCSSFLNLPAVATCRQQKFLILPYAVR